MSRSKNQQVAYPFSAVGPMSSDDLGGKGAGLKRLTLDGVPVPPGFTVTTAVARAFAQHRLVPVRLARQLRWSMQDIEKETGKVFGDAVNPLLVSVRSGARVSMPGMMDTVLNLGMNTQVVAGLAVQFGERFAYDCYRRFLSMYGEVVLGVNKVLFERAWHNTKILFDCHQDVLLPVKALQMVCEHYRELIVDETGRPVPDDPWQQLDEALLAVLHSWDSPRAQAYRRLHKIPNLGTAVNIVSMVYGNKNERSCSGVVFSANCSTGEPGLWGEFLPRAQGEDVVNGSTTPFPIADLRRWNPRLYEELEAIVLQQAQASGGVVDIEFTVDDGVLWILQVREAKLSSEATITRAVRAVWDGTLTKAQALDQLTLEQVQPLRHGGFEPQGLAEAVRSRTLARGLPASPGAVVGVVALTCQSAIELAGRGHKVVLVRPDTTPADLDGMLAASAIVTGSGGASCHAAVVARALGKPAVVGCGLLTLNEGDFVSVDGSSGLVLAGSLPLVNSGQKKEVSLFLRWFAKTEVVPPRMVFDMIDQVASCHAMVNEFYLAESMATAAYGTPLEAEANRVWRTVQVDTAERICTYLFVACAGELTHCYTHLDCARGSAVVSELVKRYKVRQDDESRITSHVIAALRAAGFEDQVRFLELAWQAFSGTWNSTLYGGRKWAGIAWAGLRFMRGEINHRVFADHAFDLAHNTGTVFGKHDMISVISSYNLQEQLTVRKAAASVRQLFETLDRRWQTWPGRVKDLYAKGLERGTW